MVSNLAAQKIFKIWSFSFTAGILIFPISYIFGDILTEVYGFNRARRVIYMGLLANLFMAGILWIAIQLPPAPAWNLQKEFAAIHSLVPRIVIASAIAYVLGELTNSFIMSRMKLKTEGKFLWMRTVTSTLGGQFIDSAIFALIGFYGVFPFKLLVSLTLSAWLFKSIYEAAATPLTYLVVGKLKKLEQVEHFDKKEKIKLF
ncbi:MAG: queuosine precursor transporter [Candidatus Aminicenantes bacterium]|nr:queuosine precursor transporter [Candidatus Aminicenantes bacterium]